MMAKYDFSQEFMEIECTPKTRGTTFPLKIKLKHLTNILASITEDWQYLLTQKKTFYHSANCKSNVIPSDYWSFYENIPVECAKRDCLPESNVNEDDKGSDLD